MVAALLAMTAEHSAARQSDAQEPASTIEQRVLDLLYSAEGADGISRKGTLRALADLGVPAVPAYLAILSGRLEPIESESSDLSMAPAFEIRPLLEEVLAELPEREVIRAVSESLDEHGSIEDQLMGIRVLAGIGSASALERILDLCGELPESHLRRPFVRARLIEAVNLALERDPRSATLLCARLQDLSEREVTILAAPLVRSAGCEGLSALTWGLLRDSRLELPLIEALGELPLRDSAHCGHDCARLVRPYLDSADWKVRRQAAHTLGALRDLEAIPALVVMLREAEPHLVPAARQALSAITGLARSGDPERWDAWYASEREWMAGRSPGLLEALHSSEAARVLAAIRELSQHPIARREATLEMGSALVDLSDELLPIAIDALGRMRSPEALPILVGILEDRNPEARELALEHLRAWTGEEERGDVQDWTEWMR